MPRKAKDKTEETKEVKIKKAPVRKSTSKKEGTSASKKGTKKSTTKKTPSKKLEEKTVEKKTVTKARKSTAKKATSKIATKKTSTKKDTTKKVRTTTKKTSSKKKIEVLEYYDLPYRYNQTVVKVLAQTPTSLFVYWDISDEDRKKYIAQYDEYFFNNTKPVLIVHNRTKNYDFEVTINDFANSWYLPIKDSDCQYEIEVGRRPINKYIAIPNDYFYITTSNEIESPNDHILFDKLSHFVYFKNIKTNKTIKKNTNLTLLAKVGKIASIADFYKKMYPEEAINFDRLDLRNPSSNNPTSSFK